VLFASVCALSAACAAPTAISTAVPTGRSPLGAGPTGLRAQGESALGTAPDELPGADASALGADASTRQPSATRARPVPHGGTLRYVAIGDSYTIGERVKVRERWPNQLVHMLGPAWGLELVANLGVTGATSADVIDEQLDEMTAEQPGFVSLLIGVNDVVQGVPMDQYVRNLRTIVKHVLTEVPRNRLVLVTIPNYTLTPQGPRYGGSGAAAQIEAFNGAMLKEAEANGLAAVDITPAADMVADDDSFVADDGLHPSGRQYAAWVEWIVPKVRQLLAEPPVSRPTQ
jgi:lysophospholipase L1-like esterase